MHSSTRPGAGEPDAPRVADLLAAADPLRCGLACPHPGEIEDLVADRLGRRQAQRVSEHLATCDSCSAYAEALLHAGQGPAGDDESVRRVPKRKPPRPRPQGVGVHHVLGLSLAGALLLMANTSALDVLTAAQLQATPVARVEPATAPALPPVDTTPAAGEALGAGMVVPATPAAIDVTDPAAAQPAEERP